ncbi:MAG: cache domain-containing protein [Nitrosomonas sp.]|nr:MAG: cache domain-containing protein [Nitrosomonas sp.]
MKSRNMQLLILGPVVLALTVSTIWWIIYSQASKLPQQLRAAIRSDYLENKKNDLKGYISLAEHAIKHLREPGIPSEDAKREARKILTNLRYREEDGYFFVYDFSGKNIVHPIKKDWVNQDKWTYQDRDGKYVIQDLIKAAREGDGFEEYIFRKPSVFNDTTGRLKYAYVVELPDWEWVLGTGIYLEDVDNFLDGTESQVSNYIHASMLWIAGIAFIGIICLGLTQRNIGKKIERLRISADLHDQVKQDLVYVIRELNNTLQRPSETSLAFPRKFLEKIRDSAQHALDWLRIIIDGKDPSNPILIDGLENAKRKFELKEQVQINFSVSRENESRVEDLSKKQVNEILMVVNEALHNISKHAAATHVALQLQITMCNVSVLIRDNGIGFDVDHTKTVSRGLGLFSMENRIQRSGGKLAIQSSDQGTTIEMVFPKYTNIWSRILCVLRNL